MDPLSGVAYSHSILVEYAVNLRNRRVFGATDSFAVISVDGRRRYKTRVIKGSNPAWNESVDLQASKNSLITVHVFDKGEYGRPYGDLGITIFRVASAFSPGWSGCEQYHGDLTLRDWGKPDQGYVIATLSTIKSAPQGIEQGPWTPEPQATEQGVWTPEPQVTEQGVWTPEPQKDLTQTLAPLPSGWEMQRTGSGRIFYVDHDTKRSSWTHPLDPNWASNAFRLGGDAAFSRTPSSTTMDNAGVGSTNGLAGSYFRPSTSPSGQAPNASEPLAMLRPLMGNMSLEAAGPPSSGLADTYFQNSTSFSGQTPSTTQTWPNFQTPVGNTGLEGAKPPFDQALVPLRPTYIHQNPHGWDATLADIDIRQETANAQLGLDGWGANPTSGGVGLPTRPYGHEPHNDLNTAPPPSTSVYQPSQVPQHQLPPELPWQPSSTAHHSPPQEDRHSAPTESSMPGRAAIVPADPPFASPNDRLAAFFPAGIRPSYTDSEILDIASLLKLSDNAWSKVPRTYIVLRSIGRLDLLGEFIGLGFSDHWFPVTPKCLPQSISPTVRSDFVKAQDLVLTKSIDLEKGHGGRHQHFGPDEHIPFEIKGVLGAGGFGQVDRVLSKISYKEYARKRMRRKAVFGNVAVGETKRFIAELEILKRFKHQHIVEFVGSYTDSTYLGLVMSPVAEMDLAAYLQGSSTTRNPELRTFFGCLATALQYLHDNQIRHKDIKPGNILVHQGNVLFTDFGLSRDSTDATGSTTSGATAFTPRYCAPEVAAYECRNTSSDIWSLGCVFLEMVVVLKGMTIEYAKDFFAKNGTELPFVRTNQAACSRLLTELERTSSQTDNKALGWVRDMVQHDRCARPTAATLVASIVAIDSTFCGICCASEDGSDSSDGLGDPNEED
ncbi:MAG: hypothetical protein M1813_004298 [Trichoglossum hirsutum]|nr:MAG: hypothetical protein M1813_004298 [Trichoglossum hirsutum]